MNDKKVKSIVLHFEDGSSREIEKGLCMTIADGEAEETAGITCDLAGCSVRDLYIFVEVAISLGARMGMFGEETDEKY